MKTMRVLGVFALALAVASAGAAVPTVLFSNIASSPTSDVPGLAGVKFQPGTGSAQFDRIFLSPNNQYWAFAAFNDSGSTADDEMLITGSGLTSAGAMLVAREGSMLSGIGENAGPLDQQVGIANNGDLAFATNTDGPTASDDYILRWDRAGGTFSAAAQEGQPVPGIAGEAYSSLATPRMDGTGKIGFNEQFSVGALPTSDDEFLIFGGAIVVQTGVTPVGNPGELWQNIDAGDFFVSGDGTQWLAQGDTDASSGDDIVAVNNVVVIREDDTLSGLADPVSSISNVWMGANGDWMARGSNDGGQDWVVRNGKVEAATGDDVPGTGGTEKFSDANYSSTFFTMVTNGVGDFIFGGTTDNPDAAKDAVLVYNGTQVIARQGDAVDLDGNGLLDDGLYLDIFNDDDMILTDNGELVFLAELADDTGAQVGQAYITYIIPEPATLSLLALGGIALLRRR
jgi:hypothetical protein